MENGRAMGGGRGAAEASAAAAAERARNEKEGSERYRRAPRRVLIVDDERDIATVMEMGLRRNGFETGKAYTARQALGEFLAGRYYDLALIDIRLPDMDGFALYERMREVSPGTRVLFLTALPGYEGRGAEGRLPHLPGRCFLQKPFTMDELVSAVKAELAAAAGVSGNAGGRSVSGAPPC